MAKESSFDVVSSVDMQEVDNAFQQAKRELVQRYDLKDSGATIDLDKTAKTLTVAAPADFVAKQVIDIVNTKIIKRGIELTALKWGKPIAATGQSVRIVGQIVQIEGDKLRVSSASRDALQEVIAFLKTQDYGQPLQYTNYR